MNRLPLWLSIVAVVIAVVALALAILLPGPQGPKGDTGAQGIQGPPSSLLVERQVVHINVREGTGPVPSIEMSLSPFFVHLNAGDVLQGYVSGSHIDVVYEVNISLPYHDSWLLGSGQGGTAFCYVAEATGRYSLTVGIANYSSLSHLYRLPYSQDVPVVYWVQVGTEQVG